ncbi:hypothetical protein GcC1_081030 [Golovinomyces cichoracearum]|uniref:Uncharacterized protein n=1 Tax=Golovinomyces cichoracearum TaxID=62708 RepID=A0A420IKC7_9PEZI|nr:hypothetical protein GcC1_081030 [Golovinomyces cichoracearum]
MFKEEYDTIIVNMASYSRNGQGLYEIASYKLFLILKAILSTWALLLGFEVWVQSYIYDLTALSNGSLWLNQWNSGLLLSAWLFAAVVHVLLSHGTVHYCNEDGIHVQVFKNEYFVRFLMAKGLLAVTAIYTDNLAEREIAANAAWLAGTVLTITIYWTIGVERHRPGWSYIDHCDGIYRVNKHSVYMETVSVAHLGLLPAAWEQEFYLFQERRLIRALFHHKLAVRGKYNCLSALTGDRECDYDMDRPAMLASVTTCGTVAWGEYKEDNTVVMKLDDSQWLRIMCQETESSRFDSCLIVHMGSAIPEEDVMTPPISYRVKEMLRAVQSRNTKVGYDSKRSRKMVASKRARDHNSVLRETGSVEEQEPELDHANTEDLAGRVEEGKEGTTERAGTKPEATEGDGREIVPETRGKDTNKPVPVNSSSVEKQLTRLVSEGGSEPRSTPAIGQFKSAKAQQIAGKGKKRSQVKPPTATPQIEEEPVGERTPVSDSESKMVLGGPDDHITGVGKTGSNKKPGVATTTSKDMNADDGVDVRNPKTVLRTQEPETFNSSKDKVRHTC